jgi:hypothetical protein
MHQRNEQVEYTRTHLSTHILMAEKLHANHRMTAADPPIYVTCVADRREADVDLQRRKIEIHHGGYPGRLPQAH